MAIQWGAWEYSGGNGMRVGIDVDWDTVSHGDSSVDATVKIYTENQFTYSDGQTLSYGGAIGGSTGFTNSAGGSPTLRATKTYTYNYGSNSYGTSPGDRTFSATLSGAYNGVTPSKSVTSAIPSRPIAAPDAPTSVSVARVSDVATKVSWTNNDSAGKPWDTLTVQKSINGGAYATVSSPSGSATSYTDTTAANQRLKYQVRATNDAGSSSYAASTLPTATTGFIYTTPAAPSGQSRADIAGPAQRITWSNAGMGYAAYSTQIIGYKNGTSVGVIGTVATGVATFDHDSSNGVSAYGASDKWKYTVRHITSSGTVLYSAETGFTSETPGVTSPPNPPTSLAPNGIIVDPTIAKALTWVYNTTDTTDQTQFQVRHRIVGAGSWTTESVVTSSTKSWNLPANTYANGDVVEWQVCTRGSNATFSSFSSSATFTCYITKKVPASIDLALGELEADVAGFDWTAPSLGNSWVNLGSGWETAAYCRRGGIVHIRGLVANGTTTAGTTIFTLPVGFRPAMPRALSTNANGAAALIAILSTGEVQCQSVGSNVFLSLDVSFPADQ